MYLWMLSFLINLSIISFSYPLINYFFQYTGIPFYESNRYTNYFRKEVTVHFNTQNIDMLHIHDIIIGVQCYNRMNRTWHTHLFSVFLHLKKYLYKWIQYFCGTLSRSKMPSTSSQTFQKEKVAEGSPRTVAHFADSGAFADCALLSNVALKR